MEQFEITESKVKEVCSGLIETTAKAVSELSLKLAVKESFRIGDFACADDVENFLRKIADQTNGNKSKSKNCFHLYVFECDSIQDSMTLTDLFSSYREMEKTKPKNQKQALCSTNKESNDKTKTLYVGKSENSIVTRIENHIGYAGNFRTTFAVKFSQWMNTDEAKKMNLTLSIYAVSVPEKPRSYHKVALELFEQALREIKQPRLGRE